MGKASVKQGMMVLTGLATVLGAIPAPALAAEPAGEAVAPSERCDTETMQAMAPAGTTVAFAAREGGGCRVHGYVTTTNPGPNRVLFVLAMPDRFNGRYVYLGVGGAAGQLPTIPSGLWGKGYALAGSDGGSGAKNGADFGFMNDPGKAADFMGRGVQVTAAATQQIARTYYRRDKMTRLISGCSGGGQMGLTNSRRFGGANFDGFLVGATPWPATAYMPHIYRIARQLQTKPASWISPELMAKAQTAILATYDGSDGAVDGIIADQRNIARFDYGILTTAGFTPAQVETFKIIHEPHSYAGPGLKGGPTVNPGYPIADVSGWSSFLLGRTPPPWPGSNVKSAGALGLAGAPFIHIMADTRTRSDHPTTDYWTLAKDADLVRIATRNGVEIPYADPMDFSALAGSGAKLIVYHGVNDQAMSYLETVAGYERLLARFPEGRSWARTFSIPGLLHCRGGVGPTAPDEELLEALVAWVEKGQAPESVVSRRVSSEKGLERTFLLCPEPMRARLNATGLDPRDAKNWSCKS